MTPHPDDLALPAAARANAFYALSRGFDQPLRWPADLAAFARTAFDPLGAAAAGAASRLADAIDAAVDRDAVAATHARLFVGPLRLDAPPWASAYLEPDGQLMGAASAYARSAYAEAGLDTTTRHEAPDHVAFELEFIDYLAFREVETGDATWFERQARFWREHLGVWLPRLLALVRDGAGGVAVYAALAELGAACAARFDAVYASAEGVRR